MIRFNWRSNLVHFCLIAAIAAAPHVGVGQVRGNQALDFDGDDDYLEVLDPISLTGSFTIEAWILVRDGAGGRICANSMGITGYDFDLYGGGSGMILRFSISNQVQISTNISAYVDVWTHVAVSGTGEIGENVNLFVNGELAETAVVDQTLVASSTNLHIGCLTIDMYYFDGAMDELRIWSAELDGPTLRTHMNRALDAGHPAYGALEGYWRFDEGAGQIAASEVGGCLCDARLGADPGSDSSDPTWTTSGVTAAEKWSMGRVKAAYK